jgi:glycerol-3-phosphate dehydrogenase
LVTIVGGKWTTYRKMAEDTLDKAAVLAGLEDRPCVTEKLQLLGWRSPNSSLLPDWLEVYGSEAVDIEALIVSEPALGESLHPRLPYPRAAVVWAARHEQARTLEDVLSRRTRALLLDAQAAIESAPAAAELLAKELGRDAAWIRLQVEEFTALAKSYLAA